MKAGHYPINICSVTAPTLLSVLISILPESDRVAGNSSTSAYRPLLQSEERCWWLRVSQGRHMPRKSAGCRWGCREVPGTPFSAQPSVVGDARVLLGSDKKVYVLPMFYCLMPPMQLLMVLLLLKSDSARCVCPRAHTTPTDPSLIPRNSMFSLNTGWQQGWCRAVLVLGPLRPRRQASEDPSSPDPLDAGGAKGGLAGSAAVPPTQGLPEQNQRGRHNRTVLLSWLCPPESPGSRRKAFPCISKGESQSWRWESKGHLAPSSLGLFRSLI